MALKLKSVKGYTGVYYHESNSRVWRGKPDKLYYIRFQDVSGKWHRERIGWLSEGITPKYCQRIRQERVAQYMHEEYLTRSERKKRAITFGDFMEQHYLPHVEHEKPRSWKDDESRYRKWIKPHLSHIPLEDIGPFHLEKLKKAMKDEGKALQTIKHVLAIVRHAFNLAADWGFYKGENPVKKIKLPPKLDNKRIRFLTPEEANDLLEELRRVSMQTHDEALIALHCGLRAGEIYNLRWADINFKTGEIHIKNSKSGDSRFVFMDDAIKDMLLRREPEDLDPSSYVFPDKNGNRKKTVSKAFFKAVDRLGLNDGIEDPRDKVVFHTLRHTFASWLAMDGTPLLTLKELMGHKSIEMTERYSHLMPDHKRKAVKAIAKALQTSKKAKEERSASSVIKLLNVKRSQG